MADGGRLEFNDAQGRRVVQIEKDLFTIGRRAGHDLEVADAQVSRDHAHIIRAAGKYLVRDLESRYGSFINGERITERELVHLDRLRFGTTSAELLFITQGTGAVERVAELAVGDLRQVSSLLEGLRAMGSSRVLDDILALVLDSAIDVAGAERGFIMLANADDNLEFKLGRGRGRQSLAGNAFQTSAKIPEQVFHSGHPKIVTDMLEGGWAVSHHETIAMGIRNVLCVPLRLMHFSESRDATLHEERRIGVLYLDSRDKGLLASPVTGAALETLANEAATAIENTRLYREALDKARMEQELSIAADLQQALLPARHRRGAGFEAIGAMTPCRAIGGDFFDYLDLPDGRIGFVLCDVSGKGPPAALMTAMIQGVFRAQAEDSHSPATAMTRVNRVLARRAIASRYATGFYGVLSPDGSFVSSNAGHNPPILVRRDGTVERLEKGGTPLGLFGGMSFEEDELTLASGDTLLMFSDGLSEAENAQLEEFGDDRLIEVIVTRRHEEPGLLLEFIQGRMREFVAGHAQNDDITALIVRWA
ncbi:MAG TPA: SpoIIE family protein phosphatase [Bryobacteraceae bacterium]|nr:SpoIIE family protein phosphatase [Bryobacteraceae bacterium]